MQMESEKLTAQQAAVEPDNQAETVTDKKKNVKKEIISWIVTLGAAVVIALGIRYFLFEPIRVDGASMNNTLANGEIMFVTKPEYLLGQPTLGDVVICRYPGRTEYFVKRLMGGPGDVIEVKNNVVYRNGEALDEPYLNPDNNDDGFSMAAFTLGDEGYFVMGDNRDNSHDSRNYYGYNAPAALTRDQIVGHVQCVVFPFGQMRGIQ